MIRKITLASIALLGLFFQPAAYAVELPDYSGPTSTATETQIAVLAGGCFWGVDAIYKHVKGVSNVVSGYSGGELDKPTYEAVSSGVTGHAEAVRIAYDPSKISYAQLLKIFFSVAHNPTELNRQGPDVGTQYRSAIFYANEEQKTVALNYIEQLKKAKAFSKPIVTQLAPLKQFHQAEPYHQNYLALHPNEPYIMFHDMPKLRALQAQFAGLYR